MKLTKNISSRTKCAWGPHAARGPLVLRPLVHRMCRLNSLSDVERPAGPLPVATGARPALPFKICASHFMLGPRLLLHTSNIAFKNCAPPLVSGPPCAKSWSSKITKNTFLEKILKQEKNWAILPNSHFVFINTKLWRQARSQVDFCEVTRSIVTWISLNLHRNPRSKA